MSVLSTDEQLDLMNTFGPWLVSTKRVSTSKSALETQKKTAVGQPYTDIKGTDVNGNPVSLSDYVGKGKYVLVDMWASWCVPCLREVPVLQQLEKTLKNKKVTFVSISIDANQEAWKKKMDEKNRHGNQLWNRKVSLGTALNVKGIPFFAIYDPEGKLYMYGAPRPSQGQGLVQLLEGLKYQLSSCMKY